MRLFSPVELPAGWDPLADPRLPVCEALSYNALVKNWPEIARLARESAVRGEAPRKTTLL